jgi:hypothetical protein
MHACCRQGLRTFGRLIWMTCAKRVQTRVQASAWISCVSLNNGTKNLGVIKWAALRWTLDQRIGLLRSLCRMCRGDETHTEMYVCVCVCVCVCVSYVMVRYKVSRAEVDSLQHGSANRAPRSLCRMCPGDDTHTHTHTHTHWWVCVCIYIYIYIYIGHRQLGV